MDAADLCTFIEHWWGEQFDKSLISGIAGAPAHRLNEFVDALRADSLNNSVDEVASGSLRPIISAERADLALRLLLYSHEVLVDSGSFGWPLSTFQNPGTAGQIRVKLMRLRSLRPLLESQAMCLTPVNSRGRHPATSTMWDGADPEAADALLQLVRHEVSGLDPSAIVERRDLQMVFAGMTGACTLATNGSGQILATNHVERLVRDALLGSAVIADKRQANLVTLAALSVPDIRGNEDLLASLRQDSEQFAEWRVALSQALSYIGDAPESERAAHEAAEIVSTELRGALARLEKNTKKSVAISTAKTGFAKFGVTGIGVGAGFAAAGGNPIGGVIGGASTATIQAAQHYIEKRRERRRGKAIIDVAALFEP